MDLKIKYSPDLCVLENMYVYYVYDGSLYQDSEVNKGNALAFIYVKITSQNQQVIHIDIKDSRINMDEVKAVAQKSINNVMI